jgi:hypothetical protein
VTRLFVALVRVLIVAISLCLLGVGGSHAQGSADLEVGPRQPHIDRPDLPEPDAALTEERDQEDDRDGSDGDTRLLARAGFVAPSMRVQRVIMARGPPVDPRPVPDHPRSSRGPPVQV